MLKLVASSVTVRSGIYGRKTFRRPVKRAVLERKLGPRLGWDARRDEAKRGEVRVR